MPKLSTTNVNNNCTNSFIHQQCHQPKHSQTEPSQTTSLPSHASPSMALIYLASTTDNPHHSLHLSLWDCSLHILDYECGSFRLDGSQPIIICWLVSLWHYDHSPLPLKRLPQHPSHFKKFKKFLALISSPSSSFEENFHRTSL